jgi:hypothetical protein
MKAKVLNLPEVFLAVDALKNISTSFFNISKYNNLEMTMTHAVFVLAVDDIEFAGAVAPVDVIDPTGNVEVIVVVAQTLSDVVTVKTTQYSVDCTCSLINTKILSLIRKIF